MLIPLCLRSSAVEWILLPIDLVQNLPVGIGRSTRRNTILSVGLAVSTGSESDGFLGQYTSMCPQESIFLDQSRKSHLFFLVVMVVVLYLGIIIIFFTDSSIKQRLYFLKHTVFIQGLQQLVEALEEESTQQSLGPSVSLLW